MTQEVNEKLLDRIRKLHAHAESAKNLKNEAEAAAFAAKVQELLTQHKLDMSQLEFDQQDKDEPIGQTYIETSPTGHKKSRIAWREQLASAVAKAHYCRILVIPGSSKVLLVGRPVDRQIAEYIITTLSGLAEVMADAAYVKYFYAKKAVGQVHEARGYRPAWLIGFVNTIRRRYAEEMVKAQAAAQSNGMSLIRLDQEQAKVEAYKDQIGRPVHGVRGSSSSNQAGFRHGAQAGEKVDIRRTGLGAGKQATHEKLSRGQSLLGGGQ